MAPRGRHADGAHDAINTDSRKAQQKLGKLVNRGGRHATYAAFLYQLPEKARPPGPDNPLGGMEARDFAEASRTTGVCRGLEGLTPAFGHNLTN